MTLKDDAVKAYKQRQANNAAWDKKNAEEFAQRAIDSLVSLIPEIQKENLTLTRLTLYTTDMLVDGLNIQAYGDEGMQFRLLKSCEKCGKEYTRRLYDLASLGEAINYEHPGYECKKDEPAPQQTVAERLEELIKEIARGEI